MLEIPKMKSGEKDTLLNVNVKVDLCIRGKVVAQVGLKRVCAFGNTLNLLRTRGKSNEKL